jgi:TonB family protein
MPRTIPLPLGYELNYRSFLICVAISIITAGVAITAAVAPSLLQSLFSGSERLSNAPSNTSANNPHSAGSSSVAADGGEKKSEQSTASAESPNHLKPHKEPLKERGDLPSHAASPWIITTQGPNPSTVPKRGLEDESDITVPNVGSFATVGPPPEMRTILGTTKSYALGPAVAPDVDAIVPARVIKQIPPVYPAAAKAARIRAVVVLDATIDTNGSLRSIHVISGSPMFVRAAIEAVMGWKFSPATIHGHPVEVPTRLRVEFSI